MGIIYNFVLHKENFFLRKILTFFVKWPLNFGGIVAPGGCINMKNNSIFGISIQFATKYEVESSFRRPLTHPTVQLSFTVT